VGREFGGSACAHLAFANRRPLDQGRLRNWNIPLSLNCESSIRECMCMSNVDVHTRSAVSTVLQCRVPLHSVTCVFSCFFMPGRLHACLPAFLRAFVPLCLCAFVPIACVPACLRALPNVCRCILRTSLGVGHHHHYLWGCPPNPRARSARCYHGTREVPFAKAWATAVRAQRA